MGKLHVGTRRIDGKTWVPVLREFKRACDAYAKKIRESGGKARVMASAATGDYHVYTPKGQKNPRPPRVGPR